MCRKTTFNNNLGITPRTISIKLLKCFANWHLQKSILWLQYCLCTYSWWNALHYCTWSAAIYRKVKTNWQVIMYKAVARNSSNSSYSVLRFRWENWSEIHNVDVRTIASQSYCWLKLITVGPCIIVYTVSS